MDSKNAIIIGMVALIAIIAIAFAATSLDLGEDEMKTQDFERFTMNVSANSEFSVYSQTEEGKTFRDENKNINVTYIDTTSLSGGLSAFGVKAPIIVNPVVSFNDVELDNPNNDILNNLSVYKDANGNYIAIYNPEGIFIVVTADNLEELIKMVNSIVFKNDNPEPTTNQTEVVIEEEPSTHSYETINGKTYKTNNSHTEDYHMDRHSDGSWEQYDSNGELVASSDPEFQRVWAERMR